MLGRSTAPDHSAAGFFPLLLYEKCRRLPSSIRRHGHPVQSGAWRFQDLRWKRNGFRQMYLTGVIPLFNKTVRLKVSRRGRPLYSSDTGHEPAGGHGSGRRPVLLHFCCFAERYAGSAFPVHCVPQEYGRWLPHIPVFLPQTGDTGSCGGHRCRPPNRFQAP